MKKLSLKFKTVIVLVSLLTIIAVICCSCNRYTTVEKAANGKARCGQRLR